MRRRKARTGTASDGLPALKVREWWIHKHSYLRRYMDILNVGMRRRWPTRVFVDLYCGPGVLIQERDNQECQGSPLLAVRQRVGFTHFFFNDASNELVNALRDRLVRLGVYGYRLYSYPADHAARVIGADLRHLQSQTAQLLGLAFIDPVGSPHAMVSMAALEELTRGIRLDLIITFHTGSYKRVLGQAAAALRGGKLDPTHTNQLQAMSHILGITMGDLISILKEWPDPRKPRSRLLLDTYRRGLMQLGYEFFESEEGIEPTIRNSLRAPLYHIVW